MVLIIIYGLLIIVLFIVLIIMIINKVNGKNSISLDSKRTVDKNILDILPFACYDELHDCFIYKDDNSCMDMVQIRTKDLKNASYDTVLYDRLKFTRLYKKYPDDIKIIAINFPSTTAEQQDFIKNKISNTKHTIYKKWLNKKLQELEWIEKNRTSREFFYMFWGKNEEEIIKRREIFISALNASKEGLISIIDKEKKIEIVHKLNNKNAMIMRKGWNGSSKHYENEIDFYKDIQPVGGITFNDESTIKTGDGYEQCLHIMTYPVDLDNFWLSNITNINNTVATIDIANEDLAVVKRNINRSMKEQRSRFNASTDYVSQSDAIHKFNDMKDLIDEINAMHEVMKRIDARVFLCDRSWLQLDEKVKNLKDKLEPDGYLTCNNLNETKNDWCSMYQTYTKQQEEQFAVQGQALTSSAVAGGNPFHFSDLKDRNGTFYGTTPTYGNVLLDIFSKTETRKFYNALCVGTMGSGKSTLLKKVFEDRAIRGDYVRAFDVSGEFEILTKTLGGKILKLDGTDKNSINPLEILRSGDDDGMNYSRHITKLNTMYKFLVPDCSNEEITKYSNCLNEFYGSLELLPKAGRQITGRAAKDYPIFSDFHNFLDKKMEEIAAKDYNDTELVVAQNEILLINKINDVIIKLITTYGKLFNQITSMDNILDEQIITFDISKLKDMESNIFDAQIFNMVSLCWDNCVTNGVLMNTRLKIKKDIAIEDVVHFVILIDESHRWINAQKLQALDMITIYMREARKYIGGIFLASQSIRDYVPEGSDSISINKLKTLFELTQYKFIFYQDSNAIPLLENVFNNVLTQSQLERIPTLETGSNILSIASDRTLEFNIFITEEEEYIFNGGL